jgi:hypothetical protein
MALAVLAAGALRAILPAQLRAGEARWVLSLVLVVLLATLIVGDPGRIDRDSTWLRVMTSTLIGVISVVNAAAVVRLVAAITIGQATFTNDANVLLASGGAVWLTNLIAFGLWYWNLDRDGAAARARGTGGQPAFVFPEMTSPQYAGSGLPGRLLVVIVPVDLPWRPGAGARSARKQGSGWTFVPSGEAGPLVGVKARRVAFAQVRLASLPLSRPRCWEDEL